MISVTEWDTCADEVIVKTMEQILEYGFTTTWVFDPEGVGTSFAYTAGMMLGDPHPELVIMGLGHQVTHELFWGVFNRIQDGEFIQPGPDHGVLGAGLVGYWIEVDVVTHWDDYPLSMAKLAMETLGHPIEVVPTEPADVKALQFVWPDEANRLPWQDGFNPKFIDKQPLLGTPPTEES